jgi:hypothetical protein
MLHIYTVLVRHDEGGQELAGDGGDLDVRDLCGAGAGADARLSWRSRPPPPPRPGHGAHTQAMALAYTSATAPAAVLKTPFIGARRALANAAAPKPAPRAPRRRRGRRQEVVDPPSSSTRPGSTDVSLCRDEGGMELEADRDAAAATLQAPWRLRIRSAGAGQGPGVPQVVPGGGADPRAVGDGRHAGHLHGPAASRVGGLFIDGGCAIWGLRTRGNGERRRRRWLRGCGRVDLPLMLMRDLGAQCADLPSARPRRRRRWQAGQRVEKKVRRGERQKARGRGFGRTVHHLHLCTSTLHTYVVYIYIYVCICILILTIHQNNILSFCYQDISTINTPNQTPAFNVCPLRCARK